MDTVNDALKILEETELEQLKKTLVSILFEKKVLHKWKFMGKFFKVAVDGTGVHHFKERHCDHCLTRSYKSFELTEKTYQSLSIALGSTVSPVKAMIGKTFKKQEKVLSRLTELLGENYVQQHEETLLTHCVKKIKKQYFHHVLEAKLICDNGFSISLGSEWIENSGKEFDKQDCESRAFKRLEEKLKIDFPRLPVCIVADGLYPNAPFFQICKKNNWPFVCVFKEGNLPTLRKEVNALKPCIEKQRTVTKVGQDKVKITQQFTWSVQLYYRGYSVYWVRCTETTHNMEDACLKEVNFEYLVSERVTFDNVTEIVTTGRLRQKIENEGFNTQKNLGYALKHKYSRTSLRASKNYYQCLQIAHMINQLFELNRVMKDHLNEWKTTLKHSWKALLGFMQYDNIDEQDLDVFYKKKVQYRYQT